MNDYIIAVKCTIAPKDQRRTRFLIPLSSTGFLFEIRAETVETAYNIALHQTRQWAIANDLDAILDAADITP